jgi:hypothetical protein
LSTLSQNNIVVNYVLNDDQVNKAKTAYDKLTDAEKKAVDETRKLNDQLKKTGQEGSESAKKVGNEMNNITSLAKSGAGLLAGFFAVSSIKGLLSDITKVTGEFQRFEAVLTNSLGSGSKAQSALALIKDFAAKTPFSVQELTASFIKLVNQGFIPTQDQLRKLGDLSSSVGKSFDQLAEAIIDAQTGEFERLKEFGIRTQKNGDVVTFTFKGIETQTKFTNQAIREYILSLGDLQGVSGSMAAISETLEGKISNLGDAWDSLLNSIGKRLAPVYDEALKRTAIFLGKLNDIFRTKEEEQQSVRNQAKDAILNSEIAKNKELEKIDLILFKSKTEKNLKLKQQEIALATFRLGLEQSVADQAKRNQSIASIGSTQVYLDAKKAVDLRKQEIAFLQESEAKILGQIDGYSQLIEEKGKSTEKDKVNIKVIQEQYQARLKLLELEFQQEKLRNELAGFDAPQTKLKAEESFLKNKFALQKEFGDKGVDLLKEESQITSLQRQIVSKELESTLKTDTLQIKGSSESIKQFEKDQAENAKKNALDGEKARKASMDKTVKDNEEAAKQINANADKLADEEFKRIKKAEEEKAAIIQASIDLAAQTTNALFNLQSQYAANDFARKQKQFDEEIRLADGNVQKITEINEKRAAAEKEYREKEFRANQLQAVANVIFNTAPIIAQYSAGLITAPLAIIASAAAAAQIAFILAQPVPEFAEGTKGKAFKGKAIVGEKGTELVTTLSGKQYYTPPTATLAQFDEPVHITPNHLLGLNDKYLSSQYFNNSGKKDSSGMQIVTKLEAIENGLKNMPVAAISLDEKGFMKKVRTPNRSTTILNNRFKN